MTQDLPIVVIGAGPVGLAAAAHLKERGLRPLVLEGGPAVGHSMRQWGHVRLFSPWRYVVDHASKRALLAAGWIAPDDQMLPTGLEVVEQYLEPLAALDGLAETIRLGMRVVAVSRRLVDKVKTPDRDAMPFVVRTVDARGAEHDILAAAVIDASGTWLQPNPMGANGLPARGERASAGRIHYGIPDVAGRERARYAGKRTLVIGTGHSAINTLIALAELIDADRTTRVFWGMRRNAPGNAFGGGEADALPARGALGTILRSYVDTGHVRILTALQVGAVEEQGDALAVRDVAGNEVARVDEIVVATGARPDLDMLRELRLDLDPALESPRVLGPLIDPNEHSCGSVRPHGAFELEQPERSLFIVGMKSYGRAPTFLLATGYEQVRSVAAYLAGDYAAAREVLLDLPETGVCNVTFGGNDASAGCCGTEPRKEKRATLHSGQLQHDTAAAGAGAAFATGAVPQPHPDCPADFASASLTQHASVSAGAGPPQHATAASIVFSSVLASAVLALALAGDSLLYAVLPLHAATFGISLWWVGVLLSVNRITRLFVYPLLARTVERTGLRRFTVAAAGVGAASTLLFAVASGPWPLLAARIAWGVAFGALSLATLAYATAAPDGAGARVGLSLSLREAGPLASIAAGTILVTSIGTRPALALLGAISILAVPLAMRLPRSGPPASRRLSRRRPAAGGPLVMSSVLGLVADGLFPATVALVLAPAGSMTLATIAAGTTLALKRAAVVVLSPLGGRAADRFGALATTGTALAVTAVGALLIACGNAVAGAGVLICGAAVASSAMPLLVNRGDGHDRLASLARLGLARDAGAAAGPLLALALFESTGGPLLYFFAAAVLLGAAGAGLKTKRAGFLLPFLVRMRGDAYLTTTFDACRPLGPRVTSNSTAAPSARERNPPPWIDEK